MPSAECFILRLFFLRLQVFVNFGQRADNPVGAGRIVLREQRHIAVTEGNADAQAANGFGGDDVVARVADYNHVCNIDTQNFGGVPQRQGAGFFLRQAVAAEYQAEVVGKSELFQQFDGKDFVFIGNDCQRDAQRFEQCQPGCGFRIGRVKTLKWSR